MAIDDSWNARPVVRNRGGGTRWREGCCRSSINDSGDAAARGSIQAARGSPGLPARRGILAGSGTKAIVAAERDEQHAGKRFGALADHFLLHANGSERAVAPYSRPLALSSFP
jgi:hypothetical protein